MSKQSTIDDEVAAILQRSRAGRNAEAMDRAKAMRAASAEADRPIFDACAAIVDWRVRVAGGAKLDDGLSEAVRGVAQLESAGCEASLGWFVGVIGYTLGLLGDFETGLEWLERSAEDALRRNDVTQRITLCASKASLLAFAQEHDRALALLQSTLALCEAGALEFRGGLLNNLAYCQVLRARRCEDDDPLRNQLAHEALRCAEQALAEKESPRYEQWHGSTLHTLGVALGMLGRFEEAEAVFAKALQSNAWKRRVRADLVIGHAEVLVAGGKHAQAADLLPQAELEAEQDLVDQAQDRILELKIKVAQHFDRHDEVAALWERRYRWLADRHRDRLKNIRRHAELFDQLKRARAIEQRAREEIESEKARREEQEQLLAMLAHEVKTPLATIRIGIDDVVASRPWVRRAIGDIDGIIQRCVQTGRLEAGKFVPRWEECDVGALVADVPLPPGQEHRLSLVAPRGIRIRTDRELLQYVMRNLVDNAIRYGARDGRADVSVVREGADEQDGVRIEIANVPGVAGWPDAQRVFTKYYRAPHAHRSIGSGLGLFLVSGLVVRLGGTVDYAPTATQVRFVVRLPSDGAAGAA